MVGPAAAMTAAVCVPLDETTALGYGDRGRAWNYVRERLYDSAVPITIGLSGEPWVKAHAVGEAVAGTDADVVIIHDADVVVPWYSLISAITAVECGQAQWAVPHTAVYRYDKASTDALIDGDHAHRRMLTRQPYDGVVGGGVVVLRAETYRDCPIDPRFVGWGGEDESWGRALTTLHGAPWRAPVPLVHLWHPHATGRATPPSRPPRIESVRLRSWYSSAVGNVARMREIIESAKAAAR